MVPVAPPRFMTLDTVEYGRSEQVTPLIRRVLAENPSKFTYRGTGTYVVGHGDVVVIDPGPVLDSHKAALERALAGETVRAILVTHCHADHSPLAAWLREQVGAPTIAFGPHASATEPDDGDDEIDDGVKLEEALDRAFSPDMVVNDGDVAFAGAGLTFTAVHTPGHTSNHMCYALAEERALFTGDHVMGWSTTVVSPPDGDMRAYVESLRKVAGRHDAVLWPTHGPSRTDAREYVQALVDHRLEREHAVLVAVRSGLDNVGSIVARLYADVPVELHKPAARSVLAHLVGLVQDGSVATDDGGRARSTSVFVPV
jgi:glyoxylase-like metal-dependent hydrolase (beta-lactamase superfamily II)